MRVPTYVPIPVRVDPSTFPITHLLRTKWDFVITASLVSASAVSAAAATTATVAMAATTQIAEAVNKIVERMASTMTTLKSIDGHLKAGILTVNQRVNLLQEQVDDLVTLTSVGCIHSLSSLCITSRLAENFIKKVTWASSWAHTSRETGARNSRTWRTPWPTRSFPWMSHGWNYILLMLFSICWNGLLVIWRSGRE